MSAGDPISRYADTVSIVARYTDATFTADPDYSVATVTWLAAGDDVPVEELREDVQCWLVEREARGHNEYETRRRHFQAGAAGAEAAIVVSVLGGALASVAGVLTQEAVAFIRSKLTERTDHLAVLTLPVAAGPYSWSWAARWQIGQPQISSS